VQAFEQYSSTWSVLPYDQDVPGATKPSTYVSFVFRYRSPGISSRIYRSDSWINHFADFLEAQGISVEKTATPKKVQVPTRRIASLPPHFLTDPESSPSPHKKPRLTTTQAPLVRILNEIFMLGLILMFQGSRRPSFELRRTVSCHGTVKQEGEGQFFLPRNWQR
jgi:hypothetical protein